MEDPTTPWLVAEAVRDSGRSPLWAWAAVGIGAAVVVAGGIVLGGGDEPGVVHTSVPASRTLP